MSRSLQLFQRATRDLERLAEDLQRLFDKWDSGRMLRPSGTTGSGSWQERVQASRTLGRERRIEAWALAEHTLTEWADWSAWRDRLVRYESPTEEVNLARWSTLDAKCDAMARRILRDSELRSIWRDAISTRDQTDLDTESPSATRLFHEVVDNDRWLQLFQALERRGAPDPQGLVDVISARDSRASEAYERLAGQQSQLLTHVQKYRRATARLSWLRLESPSSALVRLGQPEVRLVMRWYEILETQMLDDLEDALRDDVRLLIERVFAGIEELGFDDWAEDTISMAPMPRREGPTGASNANIIPAEGTGECRPLLLSIARKRHKASTGGFAPIMKRTKTQLITCQGVTRVVIFVTDTWDSVDFEREHFDELHAHWRHGVRFVFLQVGVPRSRVGVIPVDFRAPRI